VSTTTVGDLLERAEILARSLRLTAAETTTYQWGSFDATAYRLLRELVGPERAGAREQIVSHSTPSCVLNDYPSPLAEPNPEATYNRPAGRQPPRPRPQHRGGRDSRAAAAGKLRGRQVPDQIDGPCLRHSGSAS
jgi:hypothetical protein